MFSFVSRGFMANMLNGFPAENAIFDSCKAAAKTEWNIKMRISYVGQVISRDAASCDNNKNAGE